LAADLSRSWLNDLLNGKNEKRGSNHGQNRLRMVIDHDPFLPCEAASFRSILADQIFDLSQ
jgi:hypothetical protein